MVKKARASKKSKADDFSNRSVIYPDSSYRYQELVAERNCTESFENHFLMGQLKLTFAVTADKLRRNLLVCVGNPLA